MKLKLIACNVFQKELEYLIPRSPHRIDVEFLEIGEHARPTLLRQKLQERIDGAGDCDAVLLAYGLCGRATDTLRSGNVPLILPRSHDCCGILLGSRKRFEEYFSAMPSTPFSSVGFIEHGDYCFRDGEILFGEGGYEELVEQYGEDNARYVWEAMHPRLDGELQPVYFIGTPEIPFAEAEKLCRAHAAEEGREVRNLSGDLRLLAMLLNGDWHDDEFLTVPPGGSIRLLGDWDQIMTLGN